MKQHAAAALAAGALALAALGVGAAPAGAQAPAAIRVTPLAATGTPADDRDRVAQILGRQSLDGYLLRSASSRTDTLPAVGDSIYVAAVPPELLVVSNSALPFSLNDGALWAGRGTNAMVTGGVRVRIGFVHAQLAPTYTYAQNRDFALPTENPAVAPPIPPPRSPYSYPWRVYGTSIDLPVRFGDAPVRRFELGQSALFASYGAVAAGLSTENQWWGPGLRNALVMSNNAPGFGHAFVRTHRPVRTPLGTVEARYLLGRLEQSAYFDAEFVPDRQRSLNAVAATLRPALDTNLTVGFTRAVFGQMDDGDALLGRTFDFVRNVGRPNAINRFDARQTPGRDQLFSLFARYVLPADGFESYVEWARAEQPASLRDALVAPNHTQGYTLGLQFARPVPRAALAVRLQAEYTNVEQSATYADRPTGSWYTSRAVIQGYTHRGQVIGASIGPGSSGQWLGADALAARWSGGLFAGRIRWDNDAYYTIPRPEGNGLCKHDVSVLGGVRGSYASRLGTVGASATLANRLNTFYQHSETCFAPESRGVDTRNTTLALTYTAPIGR